MLPVVVEDGGGEGVACLPACLPAPCMISQLLVLGVFCGKVFIHTSFADPFAVTEAMHARSCERGWCFVEVYARHWSRDTKNIEKNNKKNLCGVIETWPLMQDRFKDRKKAGRLLSYTCSALCKTTPS